MKIKVHVMKKTWKTILIFILLPLVMGAVAGLLTMGGMEQFQMLNQPPLAPPGWLFPIVWTILYTLMGISSYIIYSAECMKGKWKEIFKDGKQRNCKSEQKRKALTIYGYQLIVNFLWPVFFFNFGWYGFSYLWLIILWVLVAVMIWEFDKISQTAALLNIPYILWLSIAGYLNLSIWLLN